MVRLPDLSTLTNAELLLLIVAAEREVVGECDGINHGPETCGGTGKVPILDPKLMRLPCPNQDGFWSEQFKAHYVGYFKGLTICTYCQGRNWVPNPDAWAMTKAVAQAGFRLTEGCWFHVAAKARYWAHCEPSEDDSGSGETVSDADPERARFLAEAKAFGLCPT